MQLRHIAVPLAILALAACQGTDEPEEEFDTSFEQEAPSPLPSGGEEGAPVPDQTSIDGGPDEAVDAQMSGENMMPDGETGNDAPTPE